MQKKQTKIAGILLVLCCVLALIVFFQTRPDTAAGEKHITISVVHSDSSKSTFSYDTDAEYLGEALTEKVLRRVQKDLTACSSPPLTEKPQTTAKNSGGASQKTAKWSIPAQTRPPFRIRIPV